MRKKIKIFNLVPTHSALSLENLENNIQNLASYFYVYLFYLSML